MTFISKNITLSFFTFGILLLLVAFNVHIRSPKVHADVVPEVFILNNKVAEADSAYDSSDSSWWLNSGGYLLQYQDANSTVIGNLPANDKWRLLYAQNNPTDTDNGFHPQNIFRLITKNSMENFSEQAYFKIVRDNFSASPERNESNGILLFMRYSDEKNLYYAGLRVDGTAVIKRKKDGIYTTLDQEPIFTGTYNKDSNPSLLPKNVWIGLKVEIFGNNIHLYSDIGETGRWTLMASTTDKDPITASAHGGIRTDFMDVMFKDFKMEKLI